MVARLLRKSDFERLLAVPARCRSVHFAAHHLPGGPSAPAQRVKSTAVNELSTALSTVADQPVDDLPEGMWLGFVIPKRHAARAVTRNVLRRQIRCAVQRHRDALQGGLWLVRLRRPFARTGFGSADSTALRVGAAGELDQLFAQATA
jgi:ribonuclease P protein component